jgi:hypothetical protein
MRWLMYAFFSLGAQELLVLVLGFGFLTALVVGIAMVLSAGKKPHHDD